MKEIPLMTNKLKAELNQMLNEHKEIVAAPETSRRGEREEKPKCVRFADRMTLHAQAEEEIYCPAAMLVGECLKLRIEE